MNKRLFLLLITGCWLLITMVAFALAQENLGARPMGMGGAFTGLADDANAIFINPAGIGTLKRESAVVSTRIAQGREYVMIGGVETTPLGNLGIGYVGSTDPIDGLNLTTYDGNVPTKYTTQTLYLAYARDLSTVIRVPENLGKLSLGFNLKFSSRKLGSANGLSQSVGSNVDVDLASVFKPNDDFSLGISFLNFLNGCEVQEIVGLNTVEERKSSVLFGASGKLFGKELIWSVEGDEVGCEWQVAKGIAFRIGQGKESFTSGFGINVGGLGVDYAYLQKDDPIHYISVSIVPVGNETIKKAGIGIE